MNILILSSVHPYKDAGIVAFDLYRGFKKRDANNVRLVVRNWDRFHDNNIKSIESNLSNFSIRFYKKVTKILARININNRKKVNINPDFHVHFFCQNSENYSTQRILNKANIKPDVIILIFTGGFLSARNIYELNKKTGAPIYWQLPDMASFTGLCHYAWNCEGYKKMCGNCPAISSNNPFDVSFDNLHYKLNYISKTNVRILIGSNWLIERAKESSLFKNKPISKVYISVNTDGFYPDTDANKLRKKYNISENTIVIGFGAKGLNHKRKGIKYILEALDLIETNKNLLFLYAGDERIVKTLKHPSKYIGRLKRNQLVDFYRACDLFVSASLQDVGPYMILEAQLCGVPVVSFSTGIASDFVKTDITGILVDELSAKALADGVNKMLKKSETEIAEIRLNCVKHSEEILTLERQVNEFYKLFKEDGINC